MDILESRSSSNQVIPCTTLFISHFTFYPFTHFIYPIFTLQQSMTERLEPVERALSGMGLEGQQCMEWSHIGEAGGRLYPIGD